MLIVLAVIFGAAEGVIVHYAASHRDVRGPVLAPALGAVLGGAVWMAMTWLGFADSGWIWLASLAAPLAVTWPAIVAVSQRRLAHDARERVRLGIA